MPPKKAPASGVTTAKKDENDPEEKNELDVDIDTFLTTCNPYMSEKCVEFDQKSQSFKHTIDFRKPVVYYRQKGTTKKVIIGDHGVVYEVVEKPKEEEKMRNKFNYRSTTTQTENPLFTDQIEQIDSSLHPVRKFSGTASKREIQMAYREHEKTKQCAERKWITANLNAIEKFIGRKELIFGDVNLKYLNLLERMIDQNMTEANLDFGYYDNPNDEFRANVGSLLPLWGVTYGPARGMDVTALTWNHHYQDLFAVGYKRQNKDEDDLSVVREDGLICVFSLKSPSYPERTFVCDSGVVHLQFHPQEKHLLAAALSNGHVSVFDLRRKTTLPRGVDSKLSESESHHDVVTEIQWLPGRIPQKFCSISDDGKIISWLFQMNDLFPAEVVTNLKIKDWPTEPPPKGLEMYHEIQEEPLENLGLNAHGTSLSVEPSELDLLLAGTDSGLIVDVSLQEGRCRGHFDQHRDSIRRVICNPFHRRVFLSCAKDMKLQLWDTTEKECMLEFFFERGVQDVAWAPYSSTLFAAITGNAVVNVYELAFNTKEPSATYVVYTNKQDVRLTRVQIHPSRPVIVVGDDRGYVVVLKMSPNLRTSLKSKETMERSKYISGEIAKMENLLISAKKIR